MIILQKPVTALVSGLFRARNQLLNFPEQEQYTWLDGLCLQCFTLSLSLSLDEIVRSLICSSQFLPLDYTELPPSCVLRCTYLQNSLLNFAAVNAARVLFLFFSCWCRAGLCFAKHYWSGDSLTNMHKPRVQTASTTGRKSARSWPDVMSPPAQLF